MVLNEVRGWQRERALAGDARAGAWARNKARTDAWTFIHRHWPQLLAMAGACAAAIAVLAGLAPGGFVRGAVVGGGAVATVALLAMFVVQLTGIAPISMGALAEQWTADELRSLRRHGWYVVNGFGLRPWDIDHLLVGAGGVFAVETKWSAHPWSIELDDYRLAAAVDQVRRNARDVLLWNGVRATGITAVTPVLVLWGGPGPGDTPPSTRAQDVDGVVVLHGLRAARTWLAELVQPDRPVTVTADQKRAVFGAVDAQIRRRDAHAKKPAATFTQLYWRGLGYFLGAVSPGVASLGVLSHTHTWTAWCVFVVTSAVAGLILLRPTRTRRLAATWLVGLTVSTVFVGAVVIVATF